MDDSRIRRRLLVADRILSTYDGRATGRDVLVEIDEADFNDPVLEELVDLFQHLPAKSRVGGLSETAYGAYIARVRALAAAVLADPRAVPVVPKND